MRVVLIDDELTTLNYNAKVINEVDGLTLVATYQKPSELLRDLEHLEFDILLSDIELPMMNGLQLATKVLDVYPKTYVVFLTAYTEYALDAFKVNAMDYLLKPIKKRDLERFIDKIHLYFNVPSKLQYGHEISYFPEFKIILNSAEVIKWPTQKAKELCAYFCIHVDEPLTREQILRDVWPEILPSQEEGHFHMTLYRLRKTLQAYQLPIEIQSSQGSKSGYVCEVKVFDQWKTLKKTLKQPLKGSYEFLNHLEGALMIGNDYPWASIHIEEFSLLIQKAIPDLKDLNPIELSNLACLFINEQKLLLEILKVLFEKDKDSANQTWIDCQKKMKSHQITVLDKTKEIIESYR